MNTVPAYIPPQIGTPGFGDESQTIRGIFLETIFDPLGNLTRGERIEAAMEELRKVQEDYMVENWDGYGAKSITEDALYEAFNLICLLPSSIPIPEFVPEPTGELALEWFLGKDHVFVASFGGRGTVTYAGIFGAGIKTHGIERFTGSLPSVLLDNLKRLYGRD